MFIKIYDIFLSVYDLLDCLTDSQHRDNVCWVPNEFCTSDLRGTVAQYWMFVCNLNSRGQRMDVARPLWLWMRLKLQLPLMMTMICFIHGRKWDLLQQQFCKLTDATMSVCSSICSSWHQFRARQQPLQLRLPRFLFFWIGDGTLAMLLELLLARWWWLCKINRSKKLKWK